MAIYQGDKLLGGITINADAKSAYEAALDGGYQGTEVEFNEFLANAKNEHQDIRESINKLIISEGTPDTLTWDGNPDGLVSVDVSGGAGNMFMYLLSEATPSLSELQTGVATVNVEGNYYRDIFFDDAVDAGNGALFAGENNFLVVPEDNMVINGIEFLYKGFYVTSEPCEGIVITIPNYTGFLTEKLNEKYLPNDIVTTKEMNETITAAIEEAFANVARAEGVEF